MNELIADILKNNLAGLTWIDRYAGLVRTASIKVKSGDTTIIKQFPVACNVTEADCTTDKYQDLVPNSTKRSIIYFEDNGVSYELYRGNMLKGTANLRLVCWFNLKKFGNTDCTYSATLINDLLSHLPINLNDYTPLANATLRIDSEEPKTAAIFNRYSYDELLNQYLLYPYDYFAVNLIVTFYMPKNCIDPVIDPDIC